jgi:hypothetical protein
MHYKYCWCSILFIENLKNKTMAKHTWSYFYNTFEKNTRNSNVKMLSLATDTFSKLKGQSNIPVTSTILNSYTPVFEAYRKIYEQYDVISGDRQGNTLNLGLILKDELPVELRKWEAAVRLVHVEDSPKEVAIFPNKRIPFLRGTYETRILRIATLSKALMDDGNFATLANEVMSFYNVLLSARDTQQQNEGGLSLASKARENQRKLMAIELYGAMALLMNYYKNNPIAVDNFFDLSLLRAKPKKKKGDKGEQ